MIFVANYSAFPLNHSSSHRHTLMSRHGCVPQNTYLQNRYWAECGPQIASHFCRLLTCPKVSSEDEIFMNEEEYEVKQFLETPPRIPLLLDKSRVILLKAMRSFAIK